MANSKATIVITGRVICRYGNGIEALFVHADAEHELHLKITTTKGIRPVVQDVLLPRRVQMKFTLNNVDFLPPDSDAALITRISDIDELHEMAPNTHVQLKPLTLSDPQSPSTSHMPALNGNWYAHVKHDAVYDIWSHNTQTRVKTYKKTIGENPNEELGDEIRAAYDIKPLNSSITLEVIPEDGPAMPPFVFENKDGSSFEIRLDNSCPPENCGDDFTLYYKVLEGEGIEIEQLPPPSKSLEAACNPIFSKPDCDMFMYYKNGNCGPWL
jgi:hypothetical protein